MMKYIMFMEKIEKEMQKNVLTLKKFIKTNLVQQNYNLKNINF